MLNFYTILIFFNFLNFFVLASVGLQNEISPRPLLPDKVYRCCQHEPYKSQRDLPVIYCYLGTPKVAFNMFQSISALIDLNPEQYELYEGADSADVWTQFEAQRSSWSINFINLKGKHIRLNPFNRTCIGIQTTSDYSLRLQVTQVDYIRVTVFALGVLLFFLSPSLADNPLFYYLTGITIGTLASVLVLFYFVVKLLPLKRPAMLGMMAGGSTIALYLFQTFYEHIALIMFRYQEYVIGYLLLSALISFVVCYRIGPVSNPRSKNLIKWSLQGFSLAMIFFSSHLREGTLAVDIVMLSLYNIPIFRWIAKFSRVCKRLLFPSKPHIQLLTEEEFRAQAEVETKKGLEELRNYCNSPQCRQWQTILRLHDPHRFAKFMEGNVHLTKEEIELYEEENKRMMDELLTDDSEED